MDNGWFYLKWWRKKKKEWRLIFNSMSTFLGLFYAQKVGIVYIACLYSYFLFLKSLFAHKYGIKYSYFI